MKELILIPVLSAILSLIANPAFSAGGHDGGGSGGKGGESGICKTTEITNTKPGHLETVAPQSEFSFWVKGVLSPNPGNFGSSIITMPYGILTQSTGIT